MTWQNLKEYDILLGFKTLFLHLMRTLKNIIFWKHVSVCQPPIYWIILIFITVYLYFYSQILSHLWNCMFYFLKSSVKAASLLNTVTYSFDNKHQGFKFYMHILLFSSFWEKKVFMVRIICTIDSIASC